MYKLLPTQMYTKGQINSTFINYENYLISLLNSPIGCHYPSYFMSLTAGEKFVAIKEQSHGECDAKAGEYAIDFKLLMPSKAVEYKVLTKRTIDYSMMKHGFITVNDTPNSLNDNMKKIANDSFQTFIEELSYSSTEQLQQSGQNKKSLVYDVVKNMKTKKNVLFFFPCNFDINDPSFFIIKKIFSSLFYLRNGLDYDTYLTYLNGIPNGEFIIIKYCAGQFITVDKIPVFLIQEFTDLYRLTNI